MTARLSVRVGEVVVDLAPDGPWIIGRHSGAAVVVDDDLVSRRHLQVAVEDGRWVLTDLDSANGTFVRGHPLRRSVVDPAVAVRLGDPDHGVEVRLSVDPPTRPPADAVPTRLVPDPPPRPA